MGLGSLPESLRLGPPGLQHQSRVRCSKVLSEDQTVARNSAKDCVAVRCPITPTEEALDTEDGSCTSSGVGAERVSSKRGQVEMWVEHGREGADGRRSCWILSSLPDPLTQGYLGQCQLFCWCTTE